MKKVLLLLILLVLPLSITSCKGKLGNRADFEKKLQEYSNLVSMSEFYKLNDKLNDHKNLIENKDFELTVDLFREDKIVAKDNDVLVRERNINEKYHEDTQVDYSNKITSVRVITEEDNYEYIDKTTNKSKRNTDVTTGVQLVDGKYHTINKNTKRATDISSYWDIKKFPVEDNFRITPDSEEYKLNVKYYIDGNVYTKVINEEDSTRKKSLIYQTTIEDNRLTYLLLESTSSGIIGYTMTSREKHNLIYREANLKDLDLKPIDLKGYTFMKAGDL